MLGRVENQMSPAQIAFKIKEVQVSLGKIHIHRIYDIDGSWVNAIYVNGENVNNVFRSFKILKQQEK